MNYAQVLTTTAVILVACGCATVPPAAPAELHAAARAIAAAKDAEAGRYLPRSVKFSEQKLDDAVDLFDRNQLAEARAAAQEAEATATRALALTQSIRDWDGTDLMAYEALRRTESGLIDARLQLSEARAAHPLAATTGPLAIAQPVAFFDTAEAAVADPSQPALNELINSLKEAPTLSVTLVGYADKRGVDTHNEALARARAVAVATYLTEQGVEPARIRIASRGARDAAAEPTDIARLQLDRRVDARIIDNNAPATDPSLAH